MRVDMNRIPMILNWVFLVLWLIATGMMANRWLELNACVKAFEKAEHVPYLMDYDVPRYRPLPDHGPAAVYTHSDPAAVALYDSLDRVKPILIGR